MLSRSVRKNSNTGRRPRRGVGGGNTGLGLTIQIAEKVPGVPARPARILRDIIAAQKNEPRIMYRRIKIQARLIHVILRLVVARRFPILKDFVRMDFRIRGLESGARKYRRNPLLDERILITANECDLLRHGVRTDAEIQPLRRSFDDVAKA